MWLAGSVKRMPAIGAASFGMSFIGWVRPFSRITLQPVGKGASSSDADFGVDPLHGAGRTSLDSDDPGHWIDRGGGRGVWGVLSGLTGPSEASGAPE